MATIPPVRFARYRLACDRTEVEPIALYRWAASVALAVFDDLATVEIAMRSAMARELASEFGLEWYRRTDILDDGTAALVGEAWRRGRLAQLTGTTDVIHGKLVATLMFGFWVKLLGRGAYRGSGTERRRVIYDSVLWKPALRRAFPHVADLDRARVETAARRVQALRNRIAHHEHIIWGVPLPGEMNVDGSPVRLPLREAHDTLVGLAGYVDAGLEGWLRQYSQVETRLELCPVESVARSL
ncbi:Abi family protein [Herbiconiux moechotypicola]|uniref:Abi family protein n=1 Tax=Herbiconiux moechotypicola TaxID=637393 RepID=A0ABN3E0D7_9MICO